MIWGNNNVREVGCPLSGEVLGEKVASYALKRVPAPAAVAVFPGEISRPPEEWAERPYNVCRWTEMPSGGHFAALEEPELLAEDVRAFFRSYRAP